jgi:hypothetical protein
MAVRRHIAATLLACIGALACDGASDDSEAADAGDAATPDAAADAAPDTGRPDATTGECVPFAGHLEAEFRGYCGSTPRDPYGRIHIQDAEAWRDFVARCVTAGADGLPAIDWTQQEVFSLNEQLDCAFGSTFLGVSLCDRRLEVHVWTHQDFCFCDYGELDFHLLLVPRGSVDRIDRIVHEEVSCADVTCLCEGESEPACDVYARQEACETDWDNYPPADRVPPAWP